MILTLQQKNTINKSIKRNELKPLVDTNAQQMLLN